MQIHRNKYQTVSWKNASKLRKEKVTINHRFLYNNAILTLREHDPNFLNVEKTPQEILQLK